MSQANSTLSVLVSTTPYLLAYSIPLLLVSIPLTFSGTFLTLDRSRSFPPSSASTLPGTFGAPQGRIRFNFFLEGGIGGLLGGYVFGVHLSTLLSVLIPSVSSSAPLSSGSFFAVWILSCILTTILAGRYKYCARIYEAISGGSLLAVTVIVIIHPSLLPRQIFVALLALVSLILILLFSLPSFSRFLRPTLRIANAASGSFSLVMSIALLAHISAWADVWERLWLQDGDGWDSAQERGLSAAYCIFMCVGFLSDWALNHWLGECPDENWDSYLANYTQNLPNDASRAGVFKPLPKSSVLSRLFGGASNPEKEILFPLSPRNNPRDSITKDPMTFLLDEKSDKAFIKPGLLDQYLSRGIPASAFSRKLRPQDAELNFFKKARKRQISPRDRKRPIRFGDLSSDSSDSELDEPPLPSLVPWLNQGASITNSSSPTLVDETNSHPEQINLRNIKTKEANQDYSDCEEDLGSPSSQGAINARNATWTPSFMSRHLSSAGTNSSSLESKTDNKSGPGPMGIVPATPSLIKALDRISVAQKAAFSQGVASGTPASSSPLNRTTTTHERPNIKELDSNDEGEALQDIQHAPRWEEFWREVKRKAEATQR